MNVFGFAFVILCVHIGGMVASMIPHGANPGNSVGVAMLWELHSLAKALIWLGKQVAPIDSALQAQLNKLAGQLDSMQAADAAKINTLEQQAAAQNVYIQTLVNALNAAKLTVPPSPNQSPALPK